MEQRSRSVSPSPSMVRLVLIIPNFVPFTESSIFLTPSQARPTHPDSYHFEPINLIGTHGSQFVGIPSTSVDWVSPQALGDSISNSTSTLISNPIGLSNADMERIQESYNPGGRRRSSTTGDLYTLRRESGLEGFGFDPLEMERGVSGRRVSKSFPNTPNPAFPGTTNLSNQAFYYEGEDAAAQRSRTVTSPLNDQQSQSAWQTPDGQSMDLSHLNQSHQRSMTLPISRSQVDSPFNLRVAIGPIAVEASPKSAPVQPSPIQDEDLPTGPVWSRAFQHPSERAREREEEANRDSEQLDRRRARSYTASGPSSPQSGGNITLIDEDHATSPVSIRQATVIDPSPKTKSPQNVVKGKEPEPEEQVVQVGDKGEGGGEGEGGETLQMKQSTEGLLPVLDEAAAKVKWDAIELDEKGKPACSYAMAIRLAILKSPGQSLNLQEIYSTLMGELKVKKSNHSPTWKLMFLKLFPPILSSLLGRFKFYDDMGPRFKNSVRYNLTINKAFLKVPIEEGFKPGNVWQVNQNVKPGKIKPKTKAKPKGETSKKKKKSKREETESSSEDDEEEEVERKKGRKEDTEVERLMNEEVGKKRVRDEEQRTVASSGQGRESSHSERTVYRREDGSRHLSRDDGSRDQGSRAHHPANSERHGSRDRNGNESSTSRRETSQYVSSLSRGTNPTYSYQATSHPSLPKSVINTLSGASGEDFSGRRRSSIYPLPSIDNLVSPEEGGSSGQRNESSHHPEYRNSHPGSYLNESSASTSVPSRNPSHYHQSNGSQVHPRHHQKGDTNREDRHSNIHEDSRSSRVPSDQLKRKMESSNDDPTSKIPRRVAPSWSGMGLHSSSASSSFKPPPGSESRSDETTDLGSSPPSSDPDPALTNLLRARRISSGSAKIITSLMNGNRYSPSTLERKLGERSLRLGGRGSGEGSSSSTLGQHHEVGGQPNLPLEPELVPIENRGINEIGQIFDSNFLGRRRSSLNLNPTPSRNNSVSNNEGVLWNNNESSSNNRPTTGSSSTNSSSPFNPHYRPVSDFSYYTSQPQTVASPSSTVALGSNPILNLGPKPSSPSISSNLNPNSHLQAQVQVQGNPQVQGNSSEWEVTNTYAHLNGNVSGNGNGIGGVSHFNHNNQATRSLASPFSSPLSRGNRELPNLNVGINLSHTNGSPSSGTPVDGIGRNHSNSNHLNLPNSPSHRYSHH